VTWLLLLDHNFNRRFLQVALRQCEPDVNDVRLIDFGRHRLTDAEVLEWAAREGRIVLSHDVRSMGNAADERVAAGLPMAGLILIPQDAPYKPVGEDLCLIFHASTPEEWQSKVERLPLQQVSSPQQGQRSKRKRR